MMKMTNILGSLFLAGLAIPAFAAEPAAKAPTGGWVVEFDEAQCVASRNYGSAEDPLIFALKAPGAGEVMQMILIRNGRGGRYAEQIEAMIGVDGEELEAASMIAMMTGEERRRLYRLNIPRDRFAKISEARTLAIKAGTEFRETLQITGMAPLLRVMDECVADLRQVWNIGPGLQDSPDASVELPAALGGRAPIVRAATPTRTSAAADPAPEAEPARGPRRARGNLVGLIRSWDYPSMALSDRAEGTLRFLLLIDETGKVADCTVTETSGIAELDAQSCALIMSRARFEPALDHDSKPVRDSHHQRIRWQVAR